MTASHRGDHFALGPVPYYAFSLGRVMALAGVKKVNGVDWHRTGTRILLATQRPDGSWFDRHPKGADVLETCWHILFLTRATVPAGPGASR